MRKLRECPACGDKSFKTLATYNDGSHPIGIEMCEECCRFARIAKTPMKDIEERMGKRLLG